MIDGNNEFIIEPEYDYLEYINSDPPHTKAFKNGEFYLFDYYGRTGRKIVSRGSRINDCVTYPNFRRQSGYLIYIDKGKYGLILCDSLKGINHDSYKRGPLFDDYMELEIADMIALKNDDRWQIYDYFGNLINLNSFDSIQHQPIIRRKERYFKVYNSGRVGLISESGETIIDTKYRNVDLLYYKVYSNKNYLSLINYFAVESINGDKYYISINGVEYKCEER